VKVGDEVEGAHPSVFAVSADAFHDDWVDLPVIKEADVGVDVAGEFFGHFNFFTPDNALGQGVHLGAPLGRAVAVLPVNALERFNEGEPGNAAVVGPFAVSVFAPDCGKVGGKCGRVDCAC